MAYLDEGATGFGKEKDCLDEDGVVVVVRYITKVLEDICDRFPHFVLTEFRFPCRSRRLQSDKRLARYDPDLRSGHYRKL